MKFERVLSRGLKQSIRYVLFLLHVLFAFLEAVALTLDVDNGAVMQDAVKDSGMVAVGGSKFRAINGRGTLYNKKKLAANRRITAPRLKIICRCWIFVTELKK